LIVHNNPSGTPSKAIYFDNENHTINYSVNYTNSSIVLTSEAVPNVPRFRLSYEKPEVNKVNVRFEMSSPQSPDEFKTYLQGKSIRK